ncbi:MAG: hypothetical protein A2Y98_02590 [Candidatus Portnoybacteria bacterium RBG_19FT_COMBO_36_7]|uniref:Uncharacterized protein n=1 Tax=Candidatus Portnoybacteria bacterium RBG_19FT_COMBO_36_7 TaxID=1801992 RepID=A0A1G2F7Z6_9BACT|nr:MAG: hypothetical protein A2Y98_02590 [Candidatus Portnoybacteria bacterium RBG_19FT_COMBO_36_7]
MHLAQALTRLPFSKVSHCRLGYWRRLAVGLNLPRSLTNVTLVIDFLPQRAHDLAILGDYL